MNKLLLVGAGGFIGSILRYLVSGYTYRFFDEPMIPYGTLAVNIIGCFLIGLLSGIAETKHFFSPEIRMLVLIGFLGGFTTFSTFGYEVFSFLKDSQLIPSLVNILLHIVLGLLAVYFGNILSRLI